MTSTENIELLVEARKTGKHWARSLRRSKQTPALVYGPKVKNTPIQIEEKLLRRYLGHKFENTIFTLKSQDTTVNSVRVILKAVDIHPLSRQPVHVDFYALDLTKSIKVNVELRFEGKAAGLQEGGLLQPLVREIEVECLADQIPEFITVDVSPLKLHDSLHVSDLKIPEGIKVISAGELAVVTVTVVKEEVAAPVVTAEAATGFAEAEVMAKGKEKEGEGAEGAAAAPAGDKAGKKPEAAGDAKKKE